MDRDIHEQLASHLSVMGMGLPHRDELVEILKENSFTRVRLKAVKLAMRSIKRVSAFRKHFFGKAKTLLTHVK